MEIAKDAKKCKNNTANYFKTIITVLVSGWKLKLSEQTNPNNCLNINKNNNTDYTMTKEYCQESLNFNELIDLFLETINRNSANFNKGKWNELYEECIIQIKLELFLC